MRSGSLGTSGNVQGVRFTAGEVARATGGTLAGDDLAELEILAGPATVATVTDGGTTRWLQPGASADEVLAALRS